MSIVGGLRVFAHVCALSYDLFSAESQLFLLFLEFKQNYC